VRAPHALQHAFLVVQQPVRQMRIQQVAQPRQQFVAVEGLGDEIARACVQCAQQEIPAVLRGEHHDRRQQRIAERAQLRHHREAAQVRHVEVHQNEVGRRLAIALHRRPRIVHQHQIAVALPGQRPVEQPQVDRLVVDDQGAGRMLAGLHHARGPRLSRRARA
jgi:hypothetical protein